MIEIHKIGIQVREGIKYVGVKYSKDGTHQPFVIIPHAELSNGQGDIALKQAVLDYLG